MIEEALIGLRKKADAGNADAQYELAQLILEEGTPDDETWDTDQSYRRALVEGTQWLMKAAQNDCVEAQTDLAKRYYYGIDFPENHEKAFEWFKRAAQSDSAEAEYFIGEMYTSDQVVGYDINAAIEWYERSATKGYQWAQLALFDIYCNGADLIERDLDKCLYWGRKAGEQGNVVAQLNLGKMFFEGTLLERDPYEAAFWLHLASDVDDEAKYYLAVLYFHGRGVEKDIPKSVELFRNLAQKGDSESMVQLAIVLSYLPQVPEDELKGWLVKASEQGHVFALELLEERNALTSKRKNAEGEPPPPGSIFGDDDSIASEEMDAGEDAQSFGYSMTFGDCATGGDDSSFADAIMSDATMSDAIVKRSSFGDEFAISDLLDSTMEQLLRKAENGDVEAQFQLGHLFEEGEEVEVDYVQAARWYQMAAADGHATALWRLSLCYYKGLGVETNEAMALQLMLLSAENGNSDAQLQLGWLYYFGEEGLEQDYTRAFDLFKKSADNWNVGALVWVGHCYQHGKGTVGDRRKACEIYRKAAELGDIPAQFKLGMMYSLGWGVRQNSKQAARWLAMAAENDHDASLVELGRMYLDGDGVEQSAMEAEMFFKRAVELGDEDAKFELGRLIYSDDDRKNTDAVQLIEEAAEQDVLEAQLFMGSLYEQGDEEHQKDLSVAAYWYQKASVQGDADAKKRLAALLNDDESLLDQTVVSDDQAVPSPNDLPGSMVANKFSILSLLGQGGMSKVFKARNVFTDRIVAIKMMHSRLLSDDVAMQRFQREAKAISRLDHPNVIRLHDFGIAFGDQPYMVLDFLKGCSLEELLEEKEQLETARSLSIFMQVIDGLSNAHDCGVVHRDIKPSNIMLIDAGQPGEQVKVVDFGIAKLFSESGDEIDKLTRTGQIAGTPCYMSPEQCQGDPLDARSDIYSLGCVLFEMLTGKIAVKGSSFFETVSMHLLQPAPSIMEARPDLSFSPQLDAIIGKMMAKNIDERYKNLYEVREDLVRLLTAAA